MKKYIIFFIIFIFRIALASGQNYGDFKLYSSYNFDDGKATDVQGNTSLHLMDSARITTDPIRGKVLTFDASEKGYAYLDPAPYKGDTISLSFWFKYLSTDPNPTGPWKQIFEFHNSSDDSNIYLMPQDGWGNGKSYLVCDTHSFYSGIYETLSGNKLSADNVWHHVVVVIAGQVWTYYLDGVLQTTKKVFGSLSVEAPSRLYFGMNPNRGDYPMSSSFDDINIYHYPLSASQVSQLYAGQTVTTPVATSIYPLIFKFEGNLDEQNDALKLTGSGYTFNNDPICGKVVSMNSGSNLNFSAQPFPASSSTINFLYKKDTYTSADSAKYIYQCSNDSSAYGIRLNVSGSATVLELVTKEKGVETIKTGKINMTAGTWYAISILHTIGTTGDKGVMRVYVNGVQTTAAANVKTFALGFDKWSLGSTQASQSAGGYYDQLEFYATAKSISDISNYYSTNLSPIEVTVDCGTTYQTIRDFGASDAWYSQLIGKYWPEAKKEKLAQLLFSKDFDSDGNPEGIGLSCWRFNIGAGSTEQGTQSLISDEQTRTECFLKTDGAYDWDKQIGQQWFLDKAVDYGVEDIIGFTNAPPVQYDRGGYAFNQSGLWNSILLTDHYDDFAKFITNVITHFDSKGIHFDYFSPVNEPQYLWGPSSDGTSSQEGSCWTNPEIFKVVKALNTAFSNQNLTTQLFVGEAGSLGSAITQIPSFWGNSVDSLKIFGLSNVSGLVSSHSYWTDDSADNLYTNRVNMKNEINSCPNPVEYFQTEYSLLGGGYQWGHSGGTAGSFSEMECGISLARIIHADLAIGNATGWQFWTAFEPTKHSGESRFALIEALTRKDLTDGIYNDCKLLYTLGQYSRFIRPGMKRIGVSRSDNVSEKDALAAQMFSSYINTATNQVVVVAVNSSYSDASVELNIENLNIDGTMKFTPYVTCDGTANNMKVHDPIAIGEKFTLPALSVVTFVGSKENADAIEKTETSNILIYPNPVIDELYLTNVSDFSVACIYDLAGKSLLSYTLEGRDATISLSSLPTGTYILKLGNGKKQVSKIFFKK